MKISENTIAEIIAHGDSTTMYEIIRTLIRSLNERDKRIKEQEEATAKMGTLYVKTEADRDRYHRMAEGLVALCKEMGQEVEAQGVVRAHGGFDELVELGELEKYSDTAITIDLD